MVGGHTGRWGRLGKEQPAPGSGSGTREGQIRLLHGSLERQEKKGQWLPMERQS